MLPLFVAFILGTAEIASVAWSAVQLNNAARAGASFGAQSHTAAVDTADIKSAAQNDAPNITNMSVTSNDSCSCVSSGSAGAADPGCTKTSTTTCVSPDVIQVSVQVNTSAIVTPIVQLPFLPATLTLHGQAIEGVVQ
jgi:Flp pilus assembly protein TadG